MAARTPDDGDDLTEGYAPRVGDVVTYTMTEQDVHALGGGPTPDPFSRGTGGVASPFASVTLAPGTVVAAVVAWVWSPATVDLRVLPPCPGVPPYYASRVRGSAPGEWEVPS